MTLAVNPPALDMNVHRLVSWLDVRIVYKQISRKEKSKQMADPEQKVAFTQKSCFKRMTLNSMAFRQKSRESEADIAAASC